VRSWKHLQAKLSIALATTSTGPPRRRRRRVADTGGETPEYAIVGSASRSRPSPATFFGRGQVESLQARVAATQPHRSAAPSAMPRHAEAGSARCLLLSFGLRPVSFCVVHRCHEVGMRPAAGCSSTMG
jgi:hypothetical protein